MSKNRPPLQPLSAEEFSRLSSQERIEYLVRAINIAGPGPFATAGVGFRR